MYAVQAKLSKREREVLRMVASDKTDREIGRLLGIRERTVRAHVSRIILKLGVTSRVGAAVVFVESRTRRPCQCGGSSMAEPPIVPPSADMSGFTRTE
ncbi:response regulator transcription factor [Actinocrispum wychmicini]|uniref:Regulatory LuxR family protein n=1 Tax=Actinocrispum wychmicini TaxID=1213861 RepID=A0A4R2JUK9_9PSEU|nr:LuxR C-terminal-related transcriptional regulator [Actinocrispum wychmicini]TCO62732.1 regulatory LuxR family protein [Actinocrispum wychmicini]